MEVGGISCNSFNFRNTFDRCNEKSRKFPWINNCQVANCDTAKFTYNCEYYLNEDDLFPIY